MHTRSRGRCRCRSCSPTRRRASVCCSRRSLASVLLHLAALAIHFSPLDLAKFDRNGPPLEIALVNAKSVSKPTKAEILAQAHLDGGGNTDANRRAKSPLPVLPRESASNQLCRWRRRRSIPWSSARREMMAQLKVAAPVAVPQPKPNETPERTELPTANEHDAAHAGIDAARSADRQGYGCLPEAAEAPLHRRARRGISLCALCRGLAAEGRAHRQSQLSRGGALAEALRQPAADDGHPRRRQRRKHRRRALVRKAGSRPGGDPHRADGRRPTRHFRPISGATPISCTSRAPGRSRRAIR